MEKNKSLITIVIGLIALFVLSTPPKAKAAVTMDVDKWLGQSGTFQCKDVKSCWIRWRDAEYRGETFYCNSVIIKRDGKVVWFKNYYK